jgi:hypothetical protein
MTMLNAQTDYRPTPTSDAALVPLFKQLGVLNEAKTAKEGRPIYDDVEVVEIRAPGSRDVKVFPAQAFSNWQIDPFTGLQRPVTYAERFKSQYNQFKEHAAQTMSGTPLQFAPFLTEGRRAELRALNIYTVEALAQVDGQELKNLGYGGRDMKNQAEAYLAKAATAAPDMQLKIENEALRARNAVLEEDRTILMAKAKVEQQFEDMPIEQLREYIVAHTGRPLQGNPSQKTLVRMAMEMRGSVVSDQ